MVTYQINWKPSALKEVKLIDRSVIPRILNVIESLSINPRPAGVRKLQGSKRSYRVRVGDYRIVYEIEDEILTVYIVRIRHRKSVYDA